jgi:hypothetical protein
VSPVSYNLDSRSDFSPVKALSFKVALDEPSAFHSIIAVGAADMDVLRGQHDSETSLGHRGMGIMLLNNRLRNGETNDNALAGIALLAGYEVSAFMRAQPASVEARQLIVTCFTAFIWDAKNIRHPHEWPRRNAQAEGRP